MAEIKNTFAQGKMNKDLDERLVPNGQYRDAMNIQISTSEGSDVGTVQNILGNSLATGIDVGVDACCVGAIADEKNDCFYWFVKGQVYSGLNVGASKDAIYKYQNGNITPVFVDVYEITASYGNHDDGANTIQIADAHAEGLCVGMVAQYIDVFNQVCYWNDNPVVSVQKDHDGLGNTLVTLKNDINLGALSPQETSTAKFKFVKKFSILTCPGAPDVVSRALNFQPNNIITGINIIEDLLFWTDNFSEPKQINIKTCIQNTDSSGKENTMLTVDEPMGEDHITVIKKAPLSAPILEMSDSLREGVIDGTTLFDFDTKSVGDHVVLDIAKSNSQVARFNWNIGDIVVLKNFDVVPDITPLTEFDIKLEVYSIVNDAQPQSFAFIEFEIISMDPGVPVGLDSNTGLAPQFVVDLYQEKDKLFEFKFPRFALRYEYPDNQFSTISGFSEIAFIPGNFDFHPRKGYNTGMTNRLSSLFIKEFVSQEVPEDVVSIDVLYKESNSPNIYILDSIKRDSNEWNQTNTNTELTGRYEVKAENISSTLPTNQTIRPWDNVPRKALAQEVTGNRIVYGNYLQNYNLVDNHPKFNVSIQEFSTASGAKVPVKSLKSLRDYQLGIVYFDKYGRQTPILTSSSASINVPKANANDSNQLKVKLNSLPPDFATHYKFYIKENSNEYYNLAMDRWYDADDGNIWVAFSSSDRNKVDEDDFIILKKGADSDDLIKESARYKILAIENNAPDYIKLKKLNQGLEFHNNSSNDIFGQDSGKFPLQSRDGFSINYDPFINSTLDNIYKGLEGSDELWVRFEQSGTAKKSKDYRITNISATTDADGVVSGTMLDMKIDGNFESDISFIYNSASNVIENATAIRFEKRRIENSPKFDGRFFVKIQRDEIFRANIDPKLSSETEYRVMASRKIYYMSPDHMSLHSAGKTSKDDWHEYGLTWENTGRFTESNSDYNMDSQNRDKLNDFFYKFTAWARTAGTLSVSDRRAHNTTPTETSFEDIWYIDGFRSSCNGEFMGADDTSGTFSSRDHTDVSSNTGFEVVGVGIVDYSTISRIELGFTGLEPDPDNFHPDRGNYGNFPTNAAYFNAPSNGSYSYVRGDSRRNGWHVGTSSIYDVGDGQRNSNYSGETSFVNALAPGTRIRWAEDPDNTVYTITGVQNIYKLRYESDTSVSNLGDRARRPENWSKNWRIWLDKPMSWNPLSPHDGQAAMNGYSPNTDPFAQFEVDGVTGTGNGAAIRDGILKAQGYTLEIIEPIFDDEELPEDPAVWETEPKQDVDINLYYEASDTYPVRLSPKNIDKYIKPNMDVKIAPWITGSSLGSITGLSGGGGSQRAYVNQINDDGTIQIIGQSGVYVDMLLQLSNPANNNLPDVLFFSDDETTIQLKVAANHFNTNNITIDYDFHNTSAVELPWFNSYSYGNGVESNRIKDTFNQVTIDKGAKVSTTLENNLYKEERVASGLIYSGIYNATSGTNDLNQFIQGEKITKDINPTYGSIQKLFSRNTDLITFCEDKVIKVLASKDALFNADGNPQLTASNNVLGQTIPFVGDYGISKNPESFAKESYRAYFTDKQRGAVLRLSKDGLTPISEAGMKTWFFDNLKGKKYLIGGFDTRKQEYNLTLKSNYLDQYSNANNYTLSYKESEKGWVSFKSFIPENSVSVANEYYTFKKGNAYKHHDKSVDRNTFYLNSGGGFTPSHVEVLFNQEPQSIKSFSSINYEGSKGQTLDHYSNQSYKNRLTTQGWYVDVVETNESVKSHALNFISKEDEWFSPLKALPHTIDTESFSMQGIGTLGSFIVTGAPLGPVIPPFTGTAPTVNATVDPLSVSQVVYSIDDSGINDFPSYFDYVITVPGQPDLTGNTVPYTNTWDEVINLTTDGTVNGTFTFYWFDPALNAVVGTLTALKTFDVILGCIDPNGLTSSSNHNPLVTVPDGSCLFDNPFVSPILNMGAYPKQQNIGLGNGIFKNEYQFYIDDSTSAFAYDSSNNPDSSHEPYVYELEYAVDSGTEDAAVASDWSVGGWTNTPTQANIPLVKSNNTFDWNQLTVAVNDLFKAPHKPNFEQPVTNGETAPFVGDYGIPYDPDNTGILSPGFISSPISLSEAQWCNVGVDAHWGFRLKVTDANGKVQYSNEVTVIIN